MDVIDISDDEYEYEVRNPDPVRREVLQEDTRPQWEKDLEEAMYLSLEDIDNKNKEQELFEQECMAEFIEKKEEREKNSTSVLSSLERLSKLDSKTKVLYDILEPILFSYKEGVIDSCSLDEETYNYIFASLRAVRLKQSDREFLQAFFSLN